MKGAIVFGGNRKLALAALLVAALLAGVGCAEACLQAAGAAEGPLVGKAYASTASAENAKAHKAYKKKLAKLSKENGGIPTRYRFIDLTGDGVDEMMVAWWPSAYTYRGGKVVRVYSGSRGGLDVTRAYKAKKVFVANSSGAYTYYKWNGKKFVAVATVMDYNSQVGGDDTYYWVKGKGEVSEQEAKAYVKKLLGKAKMTTIKYKAY